MPVPMQLSRIIISEVNEQQVIYLKEIGGERTFPILIGIYRGDEHQSPREGRGVSPPADA